MSHASESDILDFYYPYTGLQNINLNMPGDFAAAAAAPAPGNNYRIVFFRIVHLNLNY